jgi:hypothetical protein
MQFSDKDKKQILTGLIDIISTLYNFITSSLTLVSHEIV